ncbi:hypothetical protein [Streptomyces endophyticus]|uniref:Uncharacterized protein n=1 Tax=Streptomyces endophyticus TaxID=714166 RepID=A0ABU6FCV1_9ACTN|nr:hypothetical protein [Streptomyces endophyticus]MEB8341789.1 hypothetical protein [Streptomyces endophyticus]
MSDANHAHELSKCPDFIDPDTWIWAGEMVRGLPPIPRDTVLKIETYRSAFPWMPHSLKHNAVATDVRD